MPSFPSYTKHNYQDGTAGGTPILAAQLNDDEAALASLHELVGISVKDWGALGNGTTDDTTAIQLALNATPVGGVCTLPPGQFAITAPIVVPPGVTFRGLHGDTLEYTGALASPCQLKVLGSFVGSAAVKLLGKFEGGYATDNVGTRVERITVDGTAGPTTGVRGFYCFGYVREATFDRCTVRKVSDNGFVADEDTSSTDAGHNAYSLRFLHCVADNVKGAGFSFNNCPDTTLFDCNAQGCGWVGFYLAGMPNGQMIACRSEWSGSYGYYFTSGLWLAGQGSGGFNMTACLSDRNAFDGVYVDSTGAGAINLTSCTHRRDGRNNNTGGGGYAAVRVAATATMPVTISNIQVYPGVDDNGVGVNSPQYGVYGTSGGPSVAVASGYIHAANTPTGGGTNLVVASIIGTATGPTSAPARVAPSWPTGGGGGGTTTKGAPGTLFVAAADSSVADQARADYLCTGTNDQTQVQAAVNALKAAKGGRVLLSPGSFRFGAPVTISGNDNADTSVTINVQGAGQFTTFVKCAANVNGFNLSLTARVQFQDLSFYIDGTGVAISSTAVGSARHRSFDDSLFKNLHISGQYATHTGWALYLGSPFRSLFENLHIEGVKNGIRLFSEDPAQNPGDCTFNRMMVGLYNPSGTAGTAYSIESPTASGQMNQLEFIMCEAFMGTGVASGGTAFYLGGPNGVLHCKFHGINAEQFDTIWWVDNGSGNHLDANYITCRNGATGTAAIKFGTTSTNNWVKSIGSFFSNVTNNLIVSTATDTTQPNIVEHVRITTGGTTNVTNNISTAGAVVRHWTVADGAGADSVLVTPVDLTDHSVTGNEGIDGGIIETAPRFNVGDVAFTTGQLWLSYFTPRIDVTISNLGFAVGATAGATNTLCRLALFTSAADGSVTKVAQTGAAVTTASTFLERQSALNTTGGFPASYTVRRGVRYAIGLLIVGGTMPTIRKVDIVAPSLAAITTRFINGQTDIAATYAVGTLTSYFQLPYYYAQ